MSIFWKAIRKEFPNDKIVVRGGGPPPAGYQRQGSGQKLAAYTDTIKSNEFTFYGGHCTGNNAIKYFQREIRAKRWSCP